MEIVSLTTNNFQSIVELTARAIQKGAVVVAPTDTVYGLLTNAKNERSVKRLFLIKSRDPQKPLPIFIKHMAMAKSLAVIGAQTQDFLEKLWPGKLTAVLKRHDQSKKWDAKHPTIKIFGIASDTIALRIPNYPFINSLLEVLNLPLTGTSANLSGFPASTKIDEVLIQFKDAAIKPDIVVNAGDLPKSNPSTIVDLTQCQHKIIRQ